MEPKRQSEHLGKADRLLSKIRLYIRLSYDLECINIDQYKHAANRLDEIGRLLGGWQRKQKKRRR